MLTRTAPLVALLAVAVGCDDGGLDVVVELSGPGDTCDLFADDDRHVLVDAAFVDLTEADASANDVDGRTHRFSFPWYEAIVDDELLAVSYLASSDSECARGQASARARPGSDVLVTVAATCSRPCAAP